MALAKNGLEAIEVISHSKPDLILLDLNMPVLTGDQFLDQLSKEDKKEIPVLLYSILKSEAIFISSLKKSEGFIQKPLQIEEFVTKTSIYLSWNYISSTNITMKPKRVAKSLSFSPSEEKKAKVLIVDDCQDNHEILKYYFCLLYTSPSPRDQRGSRMPSSA